MLISVFTTLVLFTWTIIICWWRILSVIPPDPFLDALKKRVQKKDMKGAWERVLSQPQSPFALAVLRVICGENTGSDLLETPRIQIFCAFICLSLSIVSAFNLSGVTENVSQEAALLMARLFALGVLCTQYLFMSAYYKQCRESIQDFQNWWEKKQEEYLEDHLS